MVVGMHPATAHSKAAPLIAGYGEAMLNAHLIEDMLSLNLREAARFRTNGYQPPAVQPRTFKQMIDEFVKAFPTEAEAGPRLHLLRKVRNELIHALVKQVGSDFATDDGRAEINVMLTRFTEHAVIALHHLHANYRRLFIQTVARDFTLLFNDEAEEFDARVSQSEINRLLDQLDELDE